MSRYIDADTLKIPSEEMIAKWIVNSAPSIDLVRCKECKHWEMRNSPRGWCVVHQGYVSPQYFCADGEREGE